MKFIYIVLLAFLIIDAGLLIAVILKVISKQSCNKFDYRTVSDDGTLLNYTIVPDDGMVSGHVIASSYKMVSDYRRVSNHGIVSDLGIVSAHGIISDHTMVADNRKVSDHRMVTDNAMALDYRKTLDSVPELRIAGGDAAKIKDFPFIAAVVVKKHGMLFKEVFQCSCVIISTKCAITAAHCLYLLKEQGFAKDVIIIRSNNEKWPEGRTHDVKNWVYHEKYNEDSRDNDIGLIHVKQHFSAKFEKSISIAPKEYFYKPDTEVKVLGWGWLQANVKELLPRLNEVDIMIFDQDYCDSLYEKEGYVITNNMFCAGDLAGGKGACSFDLGGPVVEENVLVGIVSWGIGCGDDVFPSVYTRVALYRDWITKKRRNWKC